MAIIEQIKKSNLSKQGFTNPTGVFEGKPQNVAVVQRGSTVPRASSVVPAITNPIDTTFNFLNQGTYLDYLKSSPRR